MSSQRIADSLEVLDLTKLYFADTPTKSISSLRQQAVKLVASRGVFSNTVYAHLVGKATRSTLSGVELDVMIEAWLKKKSGMLWGRC